MRFIHREKLNQNDIDKCTANTHSHPYKNSAWFWIEFQFELIWRYSFTTSRSHSHHQRFGFCFCASIPWHLFSLANTMFKRTKISFTLDWNGRALHWFHECSLFRERIVWVVYSIKGNAILTVLTLRSMSEPNAGCSRILNVCVCAWICALEKRSDNISLRICYWHVKRMKFSSSISRGKREKNVDQGKDF